MEEWIGRRWHQFITRAASTEHDRARVHLDEMRRPIEMLFKAAGGSGAVRLRIASAQERGGPRSWLQKVAGSGTHDELPQLDADSLALPASIAVFAETGLNRDLYVWLAVMAACHVASGDWVADNGWATATALACFPGLRSRYERLLQLHLAQRPLPEQLKGPEAAAEAGIRAALMVDLTAASTADQHGPTTPARRPVIGVTQVAPVWLWLSPSFQDSSAPQPRRDGLEQQPDPTPRPSTQDDAKRRRAHHAQDESDRSGMMMFFRAESILSWSEHVRVNRQTDDDDDGQALKAADDMQSLAIVPDGQTSAGRIKFDLDLPAANQDDEPLGSGVKLPEWNWKKQILVPDRCSAQLLLARQSEPFRPDAALRLTAKRVRRRLEALRDLPRHVHAQSQGDELDLDAWVQWRTALQASPRHDDEARVYSRRQAMERSLACLLLADLSLSTDAWANNQQRVIDVIRDALYVFGEALTGLGDPFAMLGFSSVRRQNVRMHLLKRFNEPWNAQIQARVGAIKPGYYTRMGAAIRYAIKGLQERPERQRLLLLLTDGKPNDLDAYEGRHGLEDTRQAVVEAQTAGLVPYCVTIDQDAHDYLPFLFGQRGYAVVHRPTDLVSKLSAVYASLAMAK
ncbi:MAG: VWA domain-containing protein [Burkholderiales bacterium]|nr:VWA domain-containing protein [Burkholderiales bacterium]